MSAIADYSDLLITAGEYSGHDDVAHLFPRFVALAEKRLNRALRISNMESTATVSVAGGLGSLPSDFLEARTVYGSNRVALRSMPLSSLVENSLVRVGGGAASFAIQGDNIRVNPLWSGDLTLEYYAAIPDLTATNKTNWLLTLAPDLYLSAVVEQIYIWERNLENAAAARGMTEALISDIRNQDVSKRFALSQIYIGRGINP